MAASLPKFAAFSPRTVLSCPNELPDYGQVGTSVPDQLPMYPRMSLTLTMMTGKMTVVQNCM